jgi:hypothetical protein
MMDYAVFHQNLLGRDPKKTPSEFQITPTQERLYKAAKGEAPRHGFLLASNKPLESWERFVATFILAYAQTEKGPVAFAVSAATQRWANDQVKKVARRIFQARAASSREAVHQLYSYFQRLAIGSNVLQLTEPDRWVAYGFHDHDLLPPWMRGRLLSADGR